jgi:pimeloyl-ACP methyl ester carboxylesterase
MSMIQYADTIRLSLATGTEVQALVRLEANGTERAKCLLLHGNPGSLLDWQHIVPRLSHAVDILAIDMPGFGRSRRPSHNPECLNLDRLAEHAIAAADALSWHEPFFLIGHSHGGGVAQTAAARYPERVAGLVLIGTLGAPVHGNYRLLSLPGATTIARLVGRLFRSDRLRPLLRKIVGGVMRDFFSPEPVPTDRLDREIILLSQRPEILVSMVHVALGRPSARLFDSAPSIRCSTLFLHGRQDALVPARCAESIHHRILRAGGQSEFQLVPGAGHMLIDYQAPEIAQLILRTLTH